MSAFYWLLVMVVVVGSCYWQWEVPLGTPSHQNRTIVPSITYTGLSNLYTTTIPQTISSLLFGQLLPALELVSASVVKPSKGPITGDTFLDPCMPKPPGDKLLHIGLFEFQVSG